jgi:hypothetical protein
LDDAGDERLFATGPFFGINVNSLGERPPATTKKNCNGANGYMTPGEHSVQQKTCIRNEKILKYFGSEMRAIS